MKKDIETRADIELLVYTFYSKVFVDKQLGIIFNEVAKINWATHLQAMYNFWENIILFTGNYEGNPMNLHQHLHHIAPLNESDFEQWNYLFCATTDALFKGAKANLAKDKAISISAIISSKLFQHPQNIY